MGLSAKLYRSSTLASTPSRDLPNSVILVAAVARPTPTSTSKAPTFLPAPLRCAEASTLNNTIATTMANNAFLI